MSINLVWFREDLRIFDNPALYYASKNGEVAAIYIITPTMLKKHDVSKSKISFILAGLESLKKDLAKLHIHLKVVIIENPENIKTELLEYAKKIQATSLYFNLQYEYNEQKRDKIVKKYFEDNGIATKNFHDQCLFEPGTILTGKNQYYQIYTPFKNACWQKFKNGALAKPLPSPTKQKQFVGESKEVTRKFSNVNITEQQTNFIAAEAAAKKQLVAFVENKIIHYKNHRDFPAIDGTSKLSPYFSSGMISVQQCIAAVAEWNKNDFFHLTEGPLTWVNELLWREFYRHILIGFPRVSKHKPFKLETDKLQWNYNQDHLLLWQEGKTGVPIVDAAMRQLNQTGWMHNRLRMIVAMYLSKNLFLDWRLGEKYFMQNLIDGDLASNNGGWQWSASTGVDAVPYFRIFNPYLQSQRFDPKGKFILKYIPELEKLDYKLIHNPGINGDLFLQKIGYPKPLVDLKTSKEKTISAFKKLYS